MCIATCVLWGKSLINGFQLAQKDSFQTPALSSLLRMNVCVCGALCVCVPYPTEGSLCCLLQSLAFFLSLPFSPTAVTTADLDGKLLHPTSNSTMCASLYPCSPAPGICSIQIYSQMPLHIPLPMAPHRWSFILWWRTGLCLVIRLWGRHLGTGAFSSGLPLVPIFGLNAGDLILSLVLLGSAGFASSLTKVITGGCMSVGRRFWVLVCSKMLVITATTLL